MQFIASISLDTTRRSEVERTLPAERARVRELQEQGVLDALYVPDGSGPPDGLWAVFNGEAARWCSVRQRESAAVPVPPAGGHSGAEFAGRSVRGDPIRVPVERY